MKIVTVVGARPQFVKAAVVSRVFRTIESISEVLVHTGQHYDANMSDVFFAEMGIPNPGYHLGVGSGSHGAQTGRMLEAIEQVIVTERPDWVLVYGDTNSTLAGTVAAAKLHVPVAHVEAGLRSFNRRMPEEINRVLADHASTLLFAPTTTAVHNLQSEGTLGDKIRFVGDVMYDAAVMFAARAERESRVLAQLELVAGNFVLATIHRADNTDNPVVLATIVEALGRVGDELRVVLPIHPRTRLALERAGLWEQTRRKLTVIEPVGYLDMVMLEKSAGTVITDSGGVQKEAYFHRTPCVTLREETEWTELLGTGLNTLVPPTNADEIVTTVRRAIVDKGSHPYVSLYGDGHAAQKIAKALVEY